MGRQGRSSPEAAATLKPGRNTVAVHCKNTVGPGFIDVSIADGAEE